MKPVGQSVRSKMMSNIRSKSTAPEVLIRKALFARGFRYRINDRSLPGKPDIVFPRYKAVIFVNGCFWHGHECALFRWPKTNVDFWRRKIMSNRNRDELVDGILRNRGLRVLRLWECALRGRSQTVNVVVDQVSGWVRSGCDYAEIDGTGSDGVRKS